MGDQLWQQAPTLTSLHLEDSASNEYNYIAAKISFIALIASNFSLLLIDLALYPLSASFVAVFSLIFGLSAFLS